MIHELIDPKKKANKTSATKNIKILQENKTSFEDCNFEPRDCQNKEAESSSTTFIPPWLKNSLGLNQRNNLSHATASSEIKSTKIIQRNKELNQNEFDLKANIEQDCSKKATDHFAALSLDAFQGDNFTKGTENVEAFDPKNDREISAYWDARHKDSETESNCANAETKSPIKEDSKMANTNIMTSAEIGRLKEEEKKKLRLIKQKNKLRKRNTGDEKQLDLDKSNVDLMEMKGKETLDNFFKSDVTSEIRNFEAKLTLMSAKPPDMSIAKLSQQELQLLQDIKNQGGNIEEVERLFEHVKEMNMREIIKHPDFLSKSIAEKRREDREERNAREIMQKCTDDGKSNGDKDSLLSTDDENDIKRFSEFLSKNKNLDEKRKCLEEVRNYFEKKRRMRMTKRRFLEEEKSKLNPDTEIKEEHPKDRLRFKDFYRGRKSKFALCDEEVVEKAVDETLQKFVEMYHIHVTPTVMGNMKKNILQAMTSDSSDNPTKLSESISVKKTNLELLNTTNKEPEKVETHSFQETEIAEISNKESTIHKEIRKKNFKILTDNSGELVSKSVKESDMIENEKLKRLRKEFDNFLHSVQNNIDVTNLKLQSIILEKDEQTTLSKNVQFVYNFTKKALESERTEYSQTFSESSESNNHKDSESQTAPETELIKRNVKVQAFEQKSSCEKNLQTDDTMSLAQSTQTNDEEVIFREIKKLTSCDVNPGLYRMVKSKEAGKFYLYPEQMQDFKQDVGESGNSSVVKAKKIIKKKELLNVTTKERAKERRVFFREREKTKLKKSKKSFYAHAQLKGTPSQEEKSTIASGNSISCLYFRDFDRKNSESFSSKKELDLTDENVSERLEDSEELGLVNAKEKMQKQDHLGCFWFWDGEKITPGCDLKAHVEDLLKEKLKEITNFENRQSEFATNVSSVPRDKNPQSEISQKNLDARNANAIFSFSSVQNNTKENALVFTDNECIKEINKIERKKNEDEEIGKTPMPVSEEKSVRNAATQNSHHKFLSLNLSQLKIQSKMSAPIRRKFNKRNVVIKPSHGKTVNLKRAEDIIRAFEELRKMKLGFKNSKRENSLERQPIMDSSTSSLDSKNGAGEDQLSMVFGLKNDPEVEEISNLDFKNKFKELISFVDREIQTAETYDTEITNCTENQTMDNHKHLELIESVLNKVNHREREDFWNDIREFIKMKIGKDINDEGTREVCIEIEQDMPKNEQGKAKHAVLAKGHYTRNEGDVEVEIDLTLDDLEKILRQRQKRIRRRALYSRRKSKNFLSSSSIQSDFTKDDLLRCQKYLNRFKTLRGGFIQDQDVNVFLEK